MISLDLETDTSPLTDDEKTAGHTARGLDPAITTITAAALFDGHTPIVFTGREHTILEHLIDVFTCIPEGEHVVTWNGSVFDFPFLDARLRAHTYPVPFTLTFNPGITPKYAPTPGYRGGYTVTGPGWEHTDIAYLCRDDATARGVAWSLKPYAETLGLTPVTVDRTRMHTLTPTQLRDYVASDAIVTWQIAHAKGMR